MAQQIFLFGVVPSDVGRFIPRIVFSDATAPTEDLADAMLIDIAADWCDFLYGMGVDVDGLYASGQAAVTPTDAPPMYRTCQRYILLRFAAQVMRLRNTNNTTAAETWDGQADAIQARLRKQPQDLGQTRPTGENSPNIFGSEGTNTLENRRLMLATGVRLVVNAAANRM